MEHRRTDLAVEAKALWEESAGETTELPGVIAREETEGPYEITWVEILDAEGEEALGKPAGHYVTLDVGGLAAEGKAHYAEAAELLARELGELLPVDRKASVLVAGLGNRDMTSDAIGPQTLEHLLVTRHLIEMAPEHFAEFRPVSAIETGVMGDTGMESGELISAVVDNVKPDCIIAVDALASRATERLFRSVQLTDTGIVPGSGVGNHRMPLTEENLGVPVIAIGVPTVVDAAPLCLDVLTEAGFDEVQMEKVADLGRDFFVTPRDVDEASRSMSKVLGLGISLALHPALTVEDVEMFLS